MHHALLQFQISQWVTLNKVISKILLLASSVQLVQILSVESDPRWTPFEVSDRSLKNVNGRPFPASLRDIHSIEDLLTGRSVSGSPYIQ